MEPGQNERVPGSGLEAEHRQGDFDLLAAVLAEVDSGGDTASATAFLAQLRQRIAAGTLESPARVEAMLARCVAEIDGLLTDQVNEILHAPAFQRLEATWRGLHYLVSNCDTGSMLKVRVLNVTKTELQRDLETSIEFDMSALFQKVYEEEYGVFGGEPYGVLLADYEFDHNPADVALLERFANVAAAAHAPLIGTASAEMFGWDTFDDLAIPRDLEKIFATAEYVPWRSFRDSEDSRYVGLTLPRVLLRPPYDPETTPVDSFCFREDVAAAGRGRYLWGSPVFAFGVSLAAAFLRHGWFALIRGEVGGRIDSLPATTFDTGERDWVAKSPVEVSIQDLREKELADLGFLPLVHVKGASAAIFYSVPSCQRAKRYDSEEATASARASTQLQYLLCASRFAHHLKVMMRDKTGSGTSARELETLLTRWLSDYCLANPESAGPEMRARKPLRDARVSVRDKRDKPGAYEAVIHLQPHFLLDELSVGLRLITELPAALARA